MQASFQSMGAMTDADTLRLTEFLDSSDRPDGAFRLHELQGFLFAIASSPETIAPSEWLSLIGDEGGLKFADEDEAREILGLVMALYNEINTSVLERSNALPPGCVLKDDVAANFEEAASISLWARGFAAGHGWLEEVWKEYLFDELDDELAAALMVLSFFGSRQLAEAYYAEAAPSEHRKGDTSFEEFATTVRTMFPDALASYADIGRTIFEAVSGHDTGGREPARSTKIGRNEPCPCGSGRKYKKCCGGQLH